MATFEGTIQEFTRYIGPYTRIKVSHIAAKHKKHVGKCEKCDSVEFLDAAHVTGMERPVLIANILAEFTDQGIIKVDINEFVPRFIEAHLPIESFIRILCKKCHREYDSKKKINPIEKRTVIEESKLIEGLVNNQMNKSKAVELARQQHLTTLTNSNTIFSNVVSSLDKWWLQTSNEKFKLSLNIILNNSISNNLYIFQLPPDTIKDPAQYFKQRNDKYRTNCSDIYIPISDVSFADNKFDFGSFLKETIPY